jgi:hypothetical protein|tara:strand:- start:201 stop:590 length:390 start_codon:yes stop_codon:yes gene_type:complete
MAQQKTTLLKKAMVEALEKSLGIVTTAAKIAGIERTTHYRWMKEDAEYFNNVEDISNVALDFAESQLHKRIKNESDASIIFYLKTKGRKRGYIEKREFDHTTKGESMNEKVDLSKYSTDDLLDALSGSK